MLYRASILGSRALKQGGTWTALVWIAALFIGLMGLTILVAGGSLGSLVFHPGLLQPGESAKMVARSLGSALDGLFLVFVVALAAIPFLRAGVFGLYGQTVQGRTVSWRTFWVLGKKLYGRAWGLTGYLVLYVLTLVLFALIGFWLVRLWGLAAAGALAFLMMPWGLRMTGGLFVDQLTWRDSFRRSLTGRYYGPLLGGLALGMLGYWVVVIIVGLGLHFLGITSMPLLVGLNSVLADIVLPVWCFALYMAAGHDRETQKDTDRVPVIDPSLSDG